jgi:endonuclease/exonuclease/phosphatase family metal-dependent hydrolase
MSSFSLLTLNSFGLPFFLGWRRMRKLADELNHRDTTVICLQEIQQDVYIPVLRKRLSNFPNQCFKQNVFAPMGGLVTASRLPFTHYEFLPFPNRGRLLSIGFSDYALQKGVMIARLDVEKQPVIVMNTHIHANYLGDWQKGNKLAQIQSDQVNYLAEQASAQPKDALVIICGDFNFPRNTFLYEILANMNGFVDPLKDDPRPTYKPVSLLASKWSVTLDFIFYRKPDNIGMKIEADILSIEHAQGRNSYSKFLSDHCALTINAVWRN